MDLNITKLANMEANKANEFLGRISSTLMMDISKNAIMEKTTLEDQRDLKEILTKYGFELTDLDYTNFKKIVNMQ